MATSMNHITVTRPKRPATIRRCAVCGGLECLCRPRFFAGQLLTEEDLNRLDHYIVAKQKLHNRYLHGWGVVCGLDVQCDDCNSGSVVVTQGYALSPCGEDVVVCDDQRVSVCDLISDCRTVTEPDCDAPDLDGGCDEPVQQWILAICYAESPSRGVAPLRTPACGCGDRGTTSKSGCGCGGGQTSVGGDCGCGGHSHGGTSTGGHSHGGHSYSTASSSGSSGCGCGGSKGTVATTSASRGASLMQCENTITCERYSFRVYKAPKVTDRTKSAGALAEAFTACVEELRDSLPPLVPTGNTQQELHDWCCDMHDALAEWFLTHPTYACELARRIASVPCPNPNDPNFTAALEEARLQFVLGILDILLACFCKAIMPPCPAPATDNCVPLALVTVRVSDGCTVQSICNWTTHRKYVLTFPTLKYWLSVFPFGRLLREAIERLCCRPLLPPRRVVSEPSILGRRPRGAAAEPVMDERPARSPADNFRASAATAAASRDFMTLALQALATRDRSDSADELVRGLLGERDATGKPEWTRVESDNLLQRLVLDQMAKPMLRNLFGDAGLSMVGSMLDMASDESRETASGRSEIDDLRRAVEKQQQQIDELMRRRPRRNNP